MLLIDQIDLEARDIKCQGVSEFVFLDKCFQKGQSFESHQRETAISSCRQMLDAGLMCLIVNYQSHFTIWVESEVAPDQQQDAPKQTTDINNSPTDDEQESNKTYQQFIAKLNEPVDMKAVMAKLNEPISFKSIFSKVKDSQS